MIQTNEGINASRIIKTLRSGTVNAMSARAITVGTREIEHQLLLSAEGLLDRGAAGKVAIVEDDYGFGKSHVRSLLLGRLVEAKVPFIFGSVDARSSSLAHVHRAIPSWLSKMRIGAFSGIKDILYHQVVPISRAIEWAQGRSCVFSYGLRKGLEGQEFGWMLAHGFYYQSPDYSYQHEKAIPLLFSCADFLHHVGKGGLVLMLDEAENIDRQYDIRGRRKSYDFLGRLINHPHILPILFVTERFYNTVKSDVYWSKPSWPYWTNSAKTFAEDIQLREQLKPPKINDQMAKIVIEKISILFNKAYGLRTNGDTKDLILQGWHRTATKSVRLLVRMIVNEFDLQMQELYGSVE